MQFNWNLFLCALGLAFVLEGLPYVLFSDKLPAMMLDIAKRNPGALRYLGIISVLCGLAIIWLARKYI